MSAQPVPVKTSARGEPNNTLADILVTQGALTPNIAEQVKISEIQSGVSQEELIKKQNLVSEEALTKAKAS